MFVSDRLKYMSRLSLSCTRDKRMVWHRTSRTLHNGIIALDMCCMHVCACLNATADCARIEHFNRLWIWMFVLFFFSPGSGKNKILLRIMTTFNYISPSACNHNLIAYIKFWSLNFLCIRIHLTYSKSHFVWFYFLLTCFTSSNDVLDELIRNSINAWLYVHHFFPCHFLLFWLEWVWKLNVSKPSLFVHNRTLLPTKWICVKYSFNNCFLLNLPHERIC